MRILDYAFKIGDKGSKVPKQNYGNIESKIDIPALNNLIEARARQEYGVIKVNNPKEANIVSNLIKKTLPEYKIEVNNFEKLTGILYVSFMKQNKYSNLKDGELF